MEKTEQEKNKEEILNYLVDNPDDLIYQESVNSNKTKINVGIQILLIVSSIYYFNPVYLGLGLLLAIPYHAAYRVATSMKYSIYSNHINFSWGIKDQRSVDIPFSEILDFNLVKSHGSKNSTIHFWTKTSYPIPKQEFNTADDRAHVTFENLANGNKVYNLLKLLKNKDLATPDSIRSKKSDFLFNAPSKHLGIWKIYIANQLGIALGLSLITYLFICPSFAEEGYNIIYLFLTVIALFIYIVVRNFRIDKPNKWNNQITIDFNSQIITKNKQKLKFESIRWVDTRQYSSLIFETLYKISIQHADRGLVELIALEKAEDFNMLVKKFKALGFIVH